MNSDLTSIQKKLLAFVEDFSAESGYPPIMREVAEHFGKSISTVQQHLAALEKKGYLTRAPHSPRSLRVTALRHSTAPGPTVSVPLVGRIAAGLPIFALEQAEEILALPRSLFRGESLFSLRVTGDSMIDAGIFDGDIAVLSARPDFRDGEIAAVVVDEEATLKRIFRTEDGVRLQSENPEYPDRFVGSDQIKRSFRLAGVLVSTIRQFS